MVDVSAASEDHGRLRIHGHALELAADARGREGDRPVVFLHGGGQTRHAWGTAAEMIARSGWYTISIDFRGHGDSDWPSDGDYGIGAFAADARAVALALPTRPALVGASLGGLAALLAIGESAAESDEPLASALVLVDVTPRIEQAGADHIKGFIREGMQGFDRLEDAADAISKFIPNRPRPSNLSGLEKNLRRRDDGRWYWHWDPRFVQRPDGIDGQDGLVDHDRLVAAARRVRIPTLLVRGQMSDIVSPEGVRELRELVPDAEVIDVAEAGHMVAGDRNDAFNDAVIAFLERTKASS